MEKYILWSTVALSELPGHTLTHLTALLSDIQSKEKKHLSFSYTTPSRGGS